MTNCEHQEILHKLDKLTAKLSQKRNEMRELLAEFEDTISSIEDSDEELCNALQGLEDARDSLDAAISAASQRV